MRRPRTFQVILLMLPLLWQACFSVGAFSRTDRVATLLHAGLHGQDCDHHHHHDQSVHMEDSDEANQHSHAADGVGLADLLLSTPASGQLISPALPASTGFLKRQSVVPGGLLRPPASIA